MDGIESESEGSYSTARASKMARMEIQLCKWDPRDVIKDFGKFAAIVKNPKFVCKKCGWAANKKKWLHKPVALT